MSLVFSTTFFFFLYINFDKVNFVVLIKSFILGKNDGPNELVSLTCTFVAQ